MIPEYLQPYSVIFILAVAMVFFIWRKWSYEITAILALVVAVIFGTVPMHKIFSGIDNPAVITVASIMIITNIIAKSNVLNIIINKLEFLTYSKLLHILSFSFIIAFLSAFMNNIGALGLMLPVSIYTSLKQGHSPSYILMPLAMASALGGMATLIGTPPNLIISNFRVQVTGTPFKMFDFISVGSSTALIGILFIGLVGWKLLPKKRKEKDKFKPIYTFEIRIPPKSKWIGETSKELKKEIRKNGKILGLIRRKRKYQLSGKTMIKSGDRFVIESTLDNLQALSQSNDFIIANQIGKKNKSVLNENIFLEAIVPTKSKLQGKTFGKTSMGKLREASIIAISQETTAKVRLLENKTLQSGDMVLMQCKNEKNIRKITSIGLIPITESNIQIKLDFKTFLPLVIFVLSIILTGVIPAEISFSGAALIIMLFNRNSLKYVKEHLDWSIITLLAAMIPIGDAFIQTGGAKIIADIIMSWAQQLPIMLTIGIVLVITMCLSDLMNNAATAIVMAPIAISLSHEMKITVDPFLMAVAIGSSCAFLTPIGHQNNLLVMGPGKYNFFDYSRLGFPLEIIVFIVATPLIYYFWYLK